MPTRIEQLASNSTMYYRGDQCMEIAPFDNYYMFTIYKESTDKEQDDSVPLNLTNLGSLYLSFINGEEEVRIENYKYAEDVDMANGEVVFRIGKADAKKIIALGSNTFYISSKITDGVTASDETVLYTGEWVDFATGMKTSLTSTIQTLNNNILDLQNKLTSLKEEYDVIIDSLNSEIENLKNEIKAKDATIKELQDTIDTYNSDVVDYITANIISTGTTNASTNIINTINKENTTANSYSVSREIKFEPKQHTTHTIEKEVEQLQKNWLSNSKINKREGMVENTSTSNTTNNESTDNSIVNRGKKKR